MQQNEINHESKVFPAIFSLSFSPQGKKAVYALPQVHSLPSGLERDAALVLQQAFPFSPQQAACVLQDMLQQEAYVDKGLAWHLQHTQCTTAQEKQEQEALLHFIHSGEYRVSPSAHDDAALLESCQKILLLAQHLSSITQELAELTTSFIQQEETLAKLLADGDCFSQDSAEHLGGKEAFSSGETGSLWPVTLAAAAPFLPLDCVFYTEEKCIIQELEERFSFSPLPANIGKILTLPEHMNSSFFITSPIPLWSLLGYTRPTTLHPWEVSEHRLLIHHKP